MNECDKSAKNLLTDLFKRDLKNVLDTLENLCQGKADHFDYVKSYKYFIDTWAPILHEETVNLVKNDIGVE